MKNLIRSVTFAVFLTVVLLVTSCSDNNDTASLANVKVKMKATTAVSSIDPGARIMASDFVYTEALVGVTKIELESLEESQMEKSGDKDDDHNDDGYDDHNDDGYDDHDDEIEFKGKFVVDLLRGTSTPDFGAANIVPGVYEEIEIDLNPIMDGELTMFIAFDYTPGGAAEPVKYEYSNDYRLEYELEDYNGIEVNREILNQILVLFDLDALFSGVDLDGATADADGVVRINDGSNSGLAKQIARNLKSVMEAGEDHDDDGEFDD